MVYKLASEVCAAYHQNCSDYSGNQCHVTGICLRINGMYWTGGMIHQTNCLLHYGSNVICHL